MKYVRTKDGRIIDISNKEIDINAINDIVFEDNTYIAGDDIVKMTDTIEELCDEFVCGENHLLLKLHELKSEHFKEYIISIVYGAIWTNKGLIYVAKMNDKGEWVLL